MGRKFGGFESCEEDIKRLLEEWEGEETKEIHYDC